MNLGVHSDGVKFVEREFVREEEFEREIKNNAKKLFGEKTIYLDIKRKIETSSLGGSIPDGILFDFEDPEDIKFYLVEAELATHDFYKHIFPQITKFFAFFKNHSSINAPVSKIFSYIDENKEILEEFQKLSGSYEIYKCIKDSVENNQKILIIIDNEKPEFEEIMNTYTDTWDKFVIVEIMKKYVFGTREILILSPDFSERELIVEEELEERDKETIRYTESYHLEGTSPIVQKIYNKIKEFILEINKNLVFNPQKYYISIKDRKNFAYLNIRKKKIKIAIIMPFERGQEIIKNYRLRKFTKGIEKFYGGPSFEVTIENEENLEEIFKILIEAMGNQQQRR